MQGCGNKIGPFDCCTVVLGDCIDGMAELPEESAELVFTSPPYPGAEMWERDHTKLSDLNEKSLSAATRVLKMGGVLAWQVADVPCGDHGVMQTTTTTTIKCVSELGLKWRSHIIWDKGITNPLPAPCFMRRPAVLHLTHEHVLIFHKGSWIPREKHHRKGMTGDWRLRSVWTIGPESAKAIGHKAPFPELLATRVLDLFSIEGDLVIDPFMGSGTTGIAAKKLGRHFLGFEVEPTYHALCEKRISSAGLQSDLFAPRISTAEQVAITF